jgi:hypothetical protein
MKECIEALQELRPIQLHEVNFSLGLAEGNGLFLASIPEECETLLMRQMSLYYLIIFKTSPHHHNQLLEV